MNKSKKILIGILIVAGIGLLAWLFVESSKPLPGTKLPDLGREHVNDISKIEYNSNPPTSGTHFPVWAKKGVYDRVISDGHLIHSLEHGYVVISYNCDSDSPQTATTSAGPKPLMIMKTTAPDQMSGFTPDNPPPIEVELSANFHSDSCKSLVSQLSSFLDSYERIVIVPRPNLDTKIALTAWTKIDKFNDLDLDRMKKFINAYHNQGPERTIE